jgi:hypothetical protein
MDTWNKSTCHASLAREPFYCKAGKGGKSFDMCHLRPHPKYLILCIMFVCRINHSDAKCYVLDMTMGHLSCVEKTLCVNVCVRERAREREGGREREIRVTLSSNQSFG